MVEQDFARQERAKFQEARTRYIQIRLSEVATADEEESPGAGAEGGHGGGEAAAEDVDVNEKKKDDELQDSVFYSTSPCHVFRETTV